MFDNDKIEVTSELTFQANSGSESHKIGDPDQFYEMMLGKGYQLVSKETTKRGSKQIWVRQGRGKRR